MSIFINSNICRRLKLEIALAIPASNDGKYNWSNSAGQGLGVFLMEWILFYVAICTIIAMSRQKEAWSRDYVPLSFRMTSIFHIVHRQHYTLHSFEQFGALYMHKHDDKYPTRPGFEPGTSRLQAQPIWMSHRGRPSVFLTCFRK